MRTHGTLTEDSYTNSLIDHIGKGRGREGKRKGSLVVTQFCGSWVAKENHSLAARKSAGWNE